MKTLSESLFDNNMELSFRELTGIDIDRPHEKDLNIFQEYLKEHTIIDRHFLSNRWKVGFNWNGPGICIYKDMYGIFPGDKKSKVHYGESLLQIFYNHREEAVLFVAQTEDNKKLPPSFAVEWLVINDIIKAFGAQRWGPYGNRWKLNIKP